MPHSSYHLHLKGVVGGSDFDRNYVDYVLSRYAGKDVSVLIDSLGGNLATALSITSAFRSHGKVSVHFVGMNASAATIASLGASHVSIDANAMYLVHKCSAPFFEWASLNSDQMKDLAGALAKEAANLDKLDANVASMYAAKCKKDPKALLDLMKAGDWLTAREAMDWGFVDEITDAPEDAAPRLTDATASAMAAVGMPIPRQVPLASAEKNSPFGKFLAAIASLFRPDSDTHQNHDTKMATLTLPQICAVLAVETLTLDADSNAMFGVTELTSLEMSLAEKGKTIADLTSQLTAANEKIASLEARIAELDKKPAAGTTNVVNNPAAGADPDPGQMTFAEHYAAARAEFALLP